jgi:hypothetical protein
MEQTAVLNQAGRGDERQEQRPGEPQNRRKGGKRSNGTEESLEPLGP